MPLKVLFVINGLGGGGAERSVAEMLPELEHAGIAPLIACFYRRGMGVEASVLDRANVRFIEARRLAGRARALRGIVRVERPDIVHTTILESHLAGRLACIGAEPVVLSSLVNTPYVAARLDDPRIRARRLRMVRRADGWTARHLTDHFHAITNAVKDHAVETLQIPAERITVIERGRDPVRLEAPSPERKRRARRALGLSDADEVVVALGREEYQKGHRFLIEAASMLAARRPRLVTLVAGRTGTESESLRAAHGSIGLGDRFRFLGFRDDAPEILAAADVFAFPSLFEGLGGSLIEAMALELPIVASDIPAIREVVEEGAAGLLVPPGSASALAFAIEKVLDSPERARAYGRRGRAVFLERFTLERSTARMVELYRRLADERPDRSVRTASQAISG